MNAECCCGEHVDSLPADFLQRATALLSACGVNVQPSPGCLGLRRGTLGSALTTFTHAATTTVTITVRKGTFVGFRLFCSKGSAVGDLLITDVRVGGQSIMLSTDPIGCEATDPASKPGGLALPFTPAPVSQTIEVDVKNATQAATVSGATNANPIVVTTSAAHGFVTGDKITITGVVGNTAANVTQQTITVNSATTFTLTGVAGNGAYVSGGSAVKDYANRVVQVEGVMS